MEIIDRYIYAVTKRLPKKQKDDIEKELRSLIEDMLNEKCNGNSPSSADIEDILNELGEPNKLAAKYRDEKNYLIGPEYFYTYLFILKIVIAAIVLGIAVGKTVDIIVNSYDSILNQIINFFAAIISGAFQGFAWVTIIFAINERFKYYKMPDSKKTEWSISDLPEVPKKEAIIKPIDAIIGIIFSILFIIAFIFANHLIGIYNFDGGKLKSVISVFSEQGLHNFMPVIIALFSISILKECIKLIIGKRNITLGIAVTVLNIISLIISVFIFTNPSIWNADFISQLNASGLTNLDFLWNLITKGFIFIITLILIIDSADYLIKGFKYNK